MSTPSFENAESVDQETFEAPTEEAGVGNEQPTESSDSGGHPAWKEILDVLPSSLHPIVTPALQKWDQGVQERFQQVQSKYDPYKPIIENDVDPEQIQKALDVANMLQTDPRGFYERMQGYFGQEDQGQQKTDEDDDLYDIAEGGEEENEHWKRLEQNQQVLAEYIQKEMQAKADAEAEAKLDADLKELREKHGDFDEEFVLTYAMNNNGDLNAGVQKYNQLIGKVRGVPSPGSDLPKVIAPGGATPSTAVDPATLDSKGAKNLVVDLLMQMNSPKE